MRGSIYTSPAGGRIDHLGVPVPARYVDNKAPGRLFSGTIFRGNRFKIHRIARVTHGSAKGLWYRGTATVTGEHAKNSKGEIKPFKITGWVKASAFA